MKTIFEGKLFSGKWRRKPDSFEGRMSAQKLEQELNHIDSKLAFEVEEHIDGLSRTEEYFLEKLCIYVQEKISDRRALMFSIIPPSDDYPFWYVDTTESNIKAFAPDDIEVYIKALQLAQTFMPPMAM